MSSSPTSSSKRVVIDDGVVDGVTEVPVLPSASHPVSSEQEPLLSDVSPRIKKPWYRPRPLVLVPFAVITAICRGMTMAPRVQVFTQLACDLTLPVQNLSIKPVPQDSLPLLFHSDTYGSIATDNPPTEIRVPQISYEQCLKDPTVSAKASRLQTALLTIMGTLSALTTGWWGRFGEAHGRLMVLRFSCIGLLVTEIVFFVLSTGAIKSPVNRQSLLLAAPIVDGLLGGYNTIQASVTSYVSDCTSDGSRANIFARFHGVFFVGIAVGPEIGALIIHATGGVTTVFLCSSVFFVINLVLACFVLPESLSKLRQEELKLRHSSQNEERGLRRLISYPKTLLLPLRVFLPRRREPGESWDWSFPALAGALFCSFLNIGMFGTKYLYADHTYSWGAEQLSYFITGIGTARSIHLLLILPYILRMVKQPITPEMRRSPEYPQILAAEMHHDVQISKYSLVLDILAQLLVVLVNPKHETLFIMASFMTCFGGGVYPSLQSLALSLSQFQGDNIGSGEILGAISFLMAIGAWILGPILFGLSYSATVAFAPRTIYLIAAALLAITFVTLGFVRPYTKLNEIVQSREEESRGRPRLSKALSSDSNNSCS